MNKSFEDDCDVQLAENSEFLSSKVDIPIIIHMVRDGLIIHIA